MALCTIYTRKYSNQGNYRTSEEWIEFISQERDFIDFCNLLHDRCDCSARNIWSQTNGQDAAEDMFDLTNNPDREEERREVYGPHVSVSVGDIVHVYSSTEDSYFLCMSMSWRKIA